MIQSVKGLPHKHEDLRKIWVQCYLPVIPAQWIWMARFWACWAAFLDELMSWRLIEILFHEIE